MATGDFDANYSASPWGNVTTNQTTYYEAVLQAQYYMEHFVYGRFVGTQFNLGARNTASMVLTNLIEPHANNDAIAATSIWLPSSRLDSESRTITFADYGGKLSLHKHDALVTYWKENPSAGLERIVQRALGRMQTRVLEKLARNAFLAHSRKFIGDGSLTGFNQVDSTKVMTTNTIRAIHLGMAERDVAYANSPDGQSSAIFCVTTPGVIDGIRNSASGDWVATMRYANPMAIVNNEQGTWNGVRFVLSNEACLYNCGTVVAQTEIKAAITAGDGADNEGAAATHLGVYVTGQQSGVTKYVTVASTSGFAVGQKVTIHKTRTSANGVTNGVDYTEGSAEERIITRVVSGTRLAFDKPIMESFATDLGGTVYGFVTAARHIHTATFIGGPNGVALGVGIAPELHTPPVIDDREAMHRFSWDATLKYAPFTPEVYEVWVGAGANRIDFGAMTI